VKPNWNARDVVIVFPMLIAGGLHMSGFFGGQQQGYQIAAAFFFKILRLLCIKSV